MATRVRLACIAVLAVAAAPLANADTPAPSSPQAQVKQVVEAFRTALIAKDKARYMALFFSDQPEQIGWQFVSEDTRLAHIRQSKPDAIKARRIPANNFVSLIDGAIAAAKPWEETVDNLRVDTDGEIATATFDYRFLEGGQATNWGRESWQLVRTEAG